MTYDIFASPIGSLTVSTDGKAITGLHIEGDRYFAGIPLGWVCDPHDPLLQKSAAELKEYFAGERTTFTLPLSAVGTPFQTLVWEVLRTIPAGSTTTYGEIAQRIGKPGAVRAVGTAVGRNPICVIVPCHRVIASDGSLGGFVAGIEKKKALLTLESN